MAKLNALTLRRLRLSLIRPYRLSYRTFDEFEPYLVEVADDSGRTGFADGHISPGSSAETREGGWAFMRKHIPQMLGQQPQAAKAAVLAHFEDSKVATTALACAVEVLEHHPLLEGDSDTTLPLLTPINALDPAGIETEIESWLAQGFRTFKVKVGKDVAADLERVAVIQRAAGKHATLRLDANRAFNRDDGMRFAAALDPSGIELFEQPCDSDDWDANAAVASVSTVPLMLDEPICTLADIERAAGIRNVRFCKLKLKRFGSLERLHEGLTARARLWHGAGARRRARQRSAKLAGSLRGAHHDQQCRRVQWLSQTEGAAARAASDVHSTARSFWRRGIGRRSTGWRSNGRPRQSSNSVLNGDA